MADTAATAAANGVDVDALRGRNAAPRSRPGPRHRARVPRRGPASRRARRGRRRGRRQPRDRVAARSRPTSRCSASSWAARASTSKSTPPPNPKNAHSRPWTTKASSWVASWRPEGRWWAHCWLDSECGRTIHCPSSGSRRRGGTPTRVRLRSAVCVIEAVALLFSTLFWGRHGWFGTDDWDFLADRKAGDLGDLVRPHFQHWTTIPVVLYRLLWSVVGLRSYWPYLFVVVLAHLAVAALLRVAMQRAGVGAWLATAMVVPFVFFGAGAEKHILLAFQITFVAALAFGLIHLLLADHDGPFDRRDWLGVGAGLAALLCSGVGVTMTLVVGIAVLLRRGWRVAMVHTVPLGIVYLWWSLVAPKGQDVGQLGGQSPVQVARFVGIGVQAAFAGLGGVTGLGAVLALALLVGCGIVIHETWPTLRGRATVPASMLAGALVFLVVTGVFRAGAPGLAGLFANAGPQRRAPEPLRLRRRSATAACAHVRGGGHTPTLASTRGGRRGSVGDRNCRRRRAFGHRPATLSCSVGDERLCLDRAPTSGCRPPAPIAENHDRPSDRVARRGQPTPASFRLRRRSPPSNPRRTRSCSRCNLPPFRRRTAARP